MHTGSDLQVTFIHIFMCFLRCTLNLLLTQKGSARASFLLIKESNLGAAQKNCEKSSVQLAAGQISF